MNKKRLVASIVALSLLLFTSTAVAIGDDQYSRPSLKGLRKLVVVVQIGDPVSDDLKKAGLTEERIRTGIELKLREAKIDVIYVEDLPSDTPILHVEVNGSKRNSNTFSFLIEIELWQKSLLKRDSKIEIMAATWSTGVFGLGSASTIADNIMAWINGAMDAFVKASLSVNS
jgi:tRNA U34 5-carboxymethylaminomethyl modifying enzyme MnmG/GidA